MTVKIKKFGWAHVTTPTGEAYGCQTRIPNYWYQTVGISNVYCGEKGIPADVVSAVDAACPNRAR